MAGYTNNSNSRQTNNSESEMISAGQALLERGMAMLQSQGDKISARLYRIGDQFKECSEIFYRNEEGVLGDGFKKFGTGLKKMSHTYERSDLNEFFDRAKSYSRKNPEVLAFGLCLGAIGLVNYFRSSHHRLGGSSESYQSPENITTYDNGYLEGAEAEPSSDTRQVI